MKASGGAGVKRTQVVPIDGSGAAAYRGGHGSGDEGGSGTYAPAYAPAADAAPSSGAQRRAGGSADGLAERTYSGSSARGVPGAAGSFHHDDESLHAAPSVDGASAGGSAWTSVGSSASGGSSGKSSPAGGRGMPGGSEPEEGGAGSASTMQAPSQGYGSDYQASQQHYDEHGDDGGEGDEGEEEEEEGLYDEDGNPIDEEAYAMMHGGYDGSGYYRSDKRITWSDEHGYALCEVFYCDRLHYSPHYNFEEGTATAHCCVVS